MADMNIFPFYSLQDDELIFSSFNSCDTDVADSSNVNLREADFTSKLMASTPEFIYHTDENDIISKFQTSEYITASQFNTNSLHLKKKLLIITLQHKLKQKL